MSRGPGEPEGAGQVSATPLGELSDILADLSALAAWEGLTGAFALPRAPAGAGEATFGPPLNLAPAPTPGGSAPRPSSAPPRPQAPPESAARRPPAAPSPAAPSPAAPSVAASASAPAQGQVTLSSRWASLVTRRPPAEALQAIRDDLGDCRRCGLCERRKNIVFGVGSPEARLVVVGEAPGAREDELGEPFVGAAGEMLDRMLQNVLGLSRSQVYILNVVKCRPPENRDPLPQEIAACRPFLDRQIEAIDPKLMLCVGRIATQTLLGTTRGISGLRGQWHTWRDRIPLMATFHPAYLLRSPDEKRKTLEDLLMVKQKLAELG